MVSNDKFNGTKPCIWIMFGLNYMNWVKILLEKTPNILILVLSFKNENDEEAGKSNLFSNPGSVFSLDIRNSEVVLNTFSSIIISFRIDKAQSLRLRLILSLTPESMVLGEYSQSNQMEDVAIQSGDLLYCLMANQQEGKRLITFTYQ